ncbi:MAG: polyphosphate polymerase domain-containing protein [Christensenellales bacterium]|jgi:hypothetical protein
MNHSKYRHEYKHEINLADYYALRQRLSAAMAPDPNAAEDGTYHVRSLYFDNADDKALREKIYGLPDREKFRLRIYSGNDALIRLEKKSKSCGLCSKQSAELTRQQAQSIISGGLGAIAENSWMLESGDGLLAEFYAKISFQGLRPRTLVDYQREAYIYPHGNVRVTFDFDIRTGIYSTGFFDGDAPTLSVCRPGTLLLEVKYDRFLPDIIRDIIQTNTRRTQAFSKYAACRIYG